MKWNREEAARFVATLGLAALFASYIRYTIQGELLQFSKILLISGGILILAAIVLGFRAILGFFTRRTSQLGTNTTILGLGVLVILGIVNFAGFRHHKRFDLTSEKLFTLSDQTNKIVGGLQKDVTIIRFAKSSPAPLDELMIEYRNLSPHLKYQVIDPQEKPEVAQQYGATRMGDVIVAAGARTEHLEGGMRGNFSEEDITSAILKVTQDTLKTVCFVTGHGEKSLTDDAENGYSLVDRGLQKEGYITKSINLVSENGVPSDCSALIIAGPAQSYFPQEAALVEKYLDGGGDALILVDPETDPKLDEIFQAWNISVGKNVAIDVSGVGRLIGAGPAIPLVADYGASPITKNLKGAMTFFPLARTVSVADKAKAGSDAVDLLKTSANSFTVPNLKVKEIKFDPKTDTPGPLSLGVAATRKISDKTSRLVVIGDSDFASNSVNGMQRNGDLFYNTINWLAKEENLISIRPKPATNRRVTLTEAQATVFRWFDQFLLPGLVILSGVVIWWKRR
ncbi:MAG: Gldg family protein [Candidatus Acidiferrales bacterium]